MNDQRSTSLAIAIVLACTLGVQAFTPTRTTVISAVATIGALPEAEPAPILIRHAPLQGISLVTEEAIIQGEAGRAPRNAPTEFPARFTPEDPPLGGLPTGENLVRVTLHYRVANVDGSWMPTVTLPAITGPDPLPFAFQINPVDIIGTNVQYKIIAEHIENQAGALVVVGTTSFPTGAHLDPELWVTVGLRSQASDVFVSTGGRVVIRDGNPNDGETSIDVPANFFPTPVSVSINELPLGGELTPFVTPLSAPLALYRFETDQPFSGALKATVLYPDFVYPLGQDGILDGTSVPEALATVFWWDGQSWRPVGSSKNPTLNTLTLRVTTNMNLLAVMPAAGFSAQDSRPTQKVITPNGDGANDFVNFTFFDAAADIRVEVFDITGRRIRSLSGVSSVQWDGRDDSGSKVESGVYIYQYTDSGTRISGLVAVAK